VNNFIKQGGSALLCLLFFHHPSNALLVKLSDLHTMTKGSDIVIQGYVGDQKVEKDELGRLITLTDVEVIDGLYGKKTGDVITIYQVGGEKDGVSMPILAGQQYKIGQEIFLFGLRLGDTFVSYGAGQGKLDVRYDHGEEMVVEDLGTVHTLSFGGHNSPLSTPMPLIYENKSLFKEELKAMIRMK